MWYMWAVHVLHHAATITPAVVGKGLDVCGMPVSEYLVHALHHATADTVRSIPTSACAALMMCCMAVSPSSQACVADAAHCP